MTTAADLSEAVAAFQSLRPALQRLAYRMLGSVADAEDIVQEAFIRWMGADRRDIREPAAFLRRVVTRLCLDQLKSARRQRETYIGPWLPDPVIETEDPADDVTLPLMLALERLSPLERAALLLHDVFGVPFEEIAATLDRDDAACRQLAARARKNVRAERRRYPVDRARGLNMARAFFDASRSGDISALAALLSADVALHADGGGKRSAALAPILGREAVLKVHIALAEMFAAHGSTLVRVGLVNGLPGFVSREADGELQTTALEIADGGVVAIYVTRNPDKLRHLH